jgi:hypothetical protein
MGILVIGAGILVGLLGLVIFSLLSMAQKGDRIYDLLGRTEKSATPETCYLLLLDLFCRPAADRAVH